MNDVFRQTSLYRFLMYTNQSNLERKILDCGAGGNLPPLALFAQHGYETHGIEVNDNQIMLANEFEVKRNIKLNINRGDIRNLPFDDESFSFVYSFNTIFHMKKEDISKTVNEMKRVLKPNGLIFVNFLTVNDFRYGEGEKLGEGEFLQQEDDEKVIHTYYKIDEGDKHFEAMKLLHKENRILERDFNGEWIKQGYIDYIACKTK